MALAIIRFEDRQDGRLLFRADLGTNRYYTFAVGDRRGEGGRPQFVPAMVSPLFGPVPERVLGRVDVEIPIQHFERDARWVQLRSYRDADGRGPVRSEAVRVPLGALPRSETPPEAHAMMQTTTTSASAPAAPLAAPRHVGGVDAIPFQLREREPMSEAMFIQAIGSLLSSAIPQLGKLFGGGGLGQVIGNLLGGGGLGKLLGGAGGGQVGEALKGVLSDPKMAELIKSAVTQLLQAAGDPSKAKSLGAPPPAAHGRPAPAYSEAKVAWGALLQAIPALMPILEKVLDPKTIQAVLDQPQKLIGAVAGAITDVGKVAVDADKAENEWIAGFNPGVDDSDLLAAMQGYAPRQLLARRQAALSRRARGFRDREEIAYRRVGSVELHFGDGPSDTINDQTRVAYYHGRDIELDLWVQTPRDIPNPTLEIALKDPEELKVLARRRFKLSTLAAGQIPEPITIPQSVLSRLPPSEDYLLCATLVWLNRSGRKIGTSRIQNITLVGALTFDRMGETQEILRLDDVEQDRAFWHKIWQDSFADTARRFDIECKYYVSLDPQRDDNGRMQSIVHLEQDGRTRRRGRLKSGLLVSADALNDVLVRRDRDPLEPAALEALKTSEFADRFSYAGRTHVRFEPKHGGPGNSVAVWVYPELALRRVRFKRATAIGDDGRVGKFDDVEFTVPMPEALHFIGVTTEP